MNVFHKKHTNWRAGRKWCNNARTVKVLNMNWSRQLSHGLLSEFFTFSTKIGKNCRSWNKANLCGGIDSDVQHFWTIVSYHTLNLESVKKQDLLPRGIHLDGLTMKLLIKEQSKQPLSFLKLIQEKDGQEEVKIIKRGKLTL